MFVFIEFHAVFFTIMLYKLAWKEYGYELIQSLKETGFDKIVAGTVYPLLQKLEKQGVIVGEMRPSPDGPDRKYFSLTKEGRERLEEFWNQWQDLVIKVERVKKEGEA